MVDIMILSESDAKDLACRAPQSCFSDCPAHQGCTPGQAALKSQTKCLQCNLQREYFSFPISLVGYTSRV